MNNDLFQRFRDMSPIDKAPNLFLLNGCGTRMSGTRGVDHETGTYVTTQVVCLVFVPLFSLKSYRVANAENGGWYFLGRVPLSKFAKVANFVVLALILLGVGGVIAYQKWNDPQAVVERKFKAADKLVATGQVKEAAEAYRAIANDREGSSAAYRKLGELFDHLPENVAEAAAAFEIAAELQRNGRPIRTDLAVIGRTYAKNHAEADPQGALRILNAVAPLSTDPAADDSLRGTLLESVVAKNPDDLTNVEALAEFRLNHGDVDGSEKLLLPHEKALAPQGPSQTVREGAAILGRIFAQRGENDRAYKLLSPYVERNLGAYTSSEKQYLAESKAIIDGTLATLRTGNVQDFDFQKYKMLGKDGQEKMVDDYIGAKLDKSQNLANIKSEMRKYRGAVSAALDLGMLQLQRGRAMNDPAARKAELAKAEKTFLSIKGSAGESDSYKFTLGQVYYWLGRPDEGRKLFDGLLVPGAPLETKMAIVNVLREVGAEKEARKLCEDTYTAETDNAMKMRIAGTRALLAEDHDDELKWLQKSDANNPNTKAALLLAQGNKAEREGRRDEAVSNWRGAVAVYESQPEDSATLNNAALAVLAEYKVTGDPKALARAADKMDRALALKPSDSILLINTVSALFEAVPAAVVGKAIDCEALGRSPSWAMFPYLVEDAASYEAQSAKALANPALVKAKKLTEKLIVLAPKNPVGYRYLETIHGLAEDVPGMQSLREQALAATFEESDLAKSRDFAAGRIEEKMRTEQKQSSAGARERWEKLQSKKDATAAFAAGEYVRSRMLDYKFGEAVDPKPLVAAAEAAAAFAPSTGSRETLREALLFQAHLAMIDADPTYKAQAEKTRRTLGEDLFDLALAAPGPWQAKAKTIGERFLTLVVENTRRSPERSGPVSALLIQPRDPALAAKVKASLEAKPIRALSIDIDRKLSPYSSETAYRDWFRLTLQGKTGEASDVWKPLEAKGLPVPKIPTGN